MDGLRALDLLQLLQERFVILSGGRDRRGGPILSFPSTPRRERIKPEDIRRLLTYLFGIPKYEKIQGNSHPTGHLKFSSNFSEQSRNLGFSIVIDMRGNGNNMGSVKTILKILQEHFCSNVHNVAIIKPDNFWNKQRASISSHKYKFEV